MVFLASKFLRSKKSKGKVWSCGVVLTELNTQREVPDAIGFNSGQSHLIECKVSRADFLADKRKDFRKNPEKGMGDFRYYMCPAGMIVKSELPLGWGLIYVFGERQLERGTRLHVRPERQTEVNKTAEWHMMYSALRRLEIRDRIKEIYEPFGKDGRLY